MRSSTKKALWVSGCILAAAGLTLLIVKKAKKAEEDIDEQETKNKEDLAELGVNSEVLSNHGVSLSEDLTRGIHHTIYQSTTWDDDQIVEILDPDKALQSDACLHITETAFMGRNHLDMIFEFPNYTGDSFKSRRFPRIREIKPAMDNLATQLWSQIVVKSNKPYSKLEVYMAINCQHETGNVISFVKRIPAEWYSTPDSGKQEIRFYEDWNDEKKNGEITKMLMGNIASTEMFTNTEKCELEIADVFLGWRISFPIQTNNRGTGINLISAVKCVQYIVNDFAIERYKDDEDPLKFDHILFHEFDGGSDIPANYINLNGKLEEYVY